MMPVVGIALMTLSGMCSNDIQYATYSKCVQLANALNETTKGHIIPGYHVKTTPESDCLQFTNECIIDHTVLGLQTLTETYDYRERCRNIVRMTSEAKLNLPYPIGVHTFSESYDVVGGEDHVIANVSEQVHNLLGSKNVDPQPTYVRIILRDGTSGSGTDRRIDFWSRIETRSGVHLYTNTNGMLINENPLSQVCSSTLSDTNTVSVFGQYSDPQCTDIIRSFFVGQADSECTGVFIKAKESYEHRTMYASGVCTEDALYLTSLYDHCAQIPFDSATSIIKAGTSGNIFMLPNNGSCVQIDGSYYRATEGHSCTQFSNIRNTQSICAWRTGYIKGPHSVIGTNLTRGGCMDHARTFAGFGSWCGVAWSGPFDYEHGTCYAVVNDCRGPVPSSSPDAQWSCLIQSDHESGYRENPLFLVILIGAAFVVCPLCGVALGISIWRRHTSNYQGNLLRAARGVVTGVPLPPIREGSSFYDPNDCSPVHDWPIRMNEDGDDDSNGGGGDGDEDRNATDTHSAEQEATPPPPPADEVHAASPSSTTELVVFDALNSIPSPESIPSEEVSESNPLAVNLNAIPEE
eukprot:TRINITY_DN309_c4_g1_i1.p1 TRINITY_DN309_c4_g1~~TRINITY_DN309_c4_g1_i1.p1  ORF type:complete len:611 (+),score=72.76 TRINITY_DN309_c4_g1_i1:101-1834(+)